MYKAQSQAGFTLIELLVVITIIGVLATIALASLGSARDKAHVGNAQSEMQGLRTAFALLEGDTGLYPNGIQELCPTASNAYDLGAPASGLTGQGAFGSGWDGPYVRSANDPWGNPYFYDEDYTCTTAMEGCDANIANISVIVSCGEDGQIAGGSCVENDDNIVFKLCD